MQQNKINQAQNLNEHQIDNGMELLKSVIRSNEVNLEMGAELSGKIEDFSNIVGELEYKLRSISRQLELSGNMNNSFLEKFKQLIEQIPQKHYMDFSEKSIATFDKLDERLTKFENKTEIFKKQKTATYSVIGFAVFIIILSFYFSKQFYQTSIKTKMEIRTELLQEIENEEKGIYEKSQVEQLQQNTELINKWMKKNPKDAEKFLRFKDGYEAR